MGDQVDGAAQPPEDKTLQGLSRTVTRQAREIAALKAKPESPKDERAALEDTIGEVLEREGANDKDAQIERLSRQVRAQEAALRYRDLPIVQKLLDRGLPVEALQDEEFIRELRGTGAEPIYAGPSHNPVRGTLSQEQQDEQALRNLRSLWPEGM